MNTPRITKTLSGTSQWSDYTNSDLLGDIMEAMNRNVKGSSSEYWEFLLVMNRKTHAQIWMHPDIQYVLLKYPDTHYIYKVFKSIHFDDTLKDGIVVIYKADSEYYEALKVL